MSLKDNYKKHLIYLQKLAEEYSEKMIKRIYESIRLSDWETTADDVVDLLWQGYERNYKMTKEFLKSNYGIESSLEPFLSDFKALSYHRDGIDIEERTRRKIADYQVNELDPFIKKRVAYEIGRQENTEHKYFFFNFTKQKLVDVFPSSRIYVSIENPDGFEDCLEHGGDWHGPVCEEYYHKIQHRCITELQDSDLPPYHPDCECYPIFEVEQEEFI